MTRPIGYYVHHHGDGHRQRALCIAAQAPDRFVLMGTGLRDRTEGLASLDLEDDRPTGEMGFDGNDRADDRPTALHYAPIDHEGLRRRVARVADWIATARPALMVVDVSVEIAMLARLAATPTVYVRQQGLRTDAPHLDAFRGARALLCPFAAPLEDPGTAAWVRDKTVYCPGLTPPSPTRAVWGDGVLIVSGQGGAAADGDRIAALARAYPGRRWRVAGPMTEPADPPPNLKALGWCPAIAEEIGSAGLVVGGGGNGLVSAVLAAGRPFLCLPEPRPFDEQRIAARRLAAVGAAVTHDGWPPIAAWAGLMEAADRIDPDTQRALSDPDGPGRTARRLIALADGALIAPDPLPAPFPETPA